MDGWAEDDVNDIKLSSTIQALFPNMHFTILSCLLVPRIGRFESALGRPNLCLRCAFLIEFLRKPGRNSLHSKCRSSVAGDISWCDRWLAELLMESQITVILPGRRSWQRSYAYYERHKYCIVEVYLLKLDIIINDVAKAFFEHLKVYYSIYKR